jgi:hypothetical protein
MVRPDCIYTDYYKGKDIKKLGKSSDATNSIMIQNRLEFNGKIRPLNCNFLSMRI